MRAHKGDGWRYRQRGLKPSAYRVLCVCVCMCLSSCVTHGTSSSELNPSRHVVCSEVSVVIRRVATSRSLKILSLDVF